MLTVDYITCLKSNQRYTFGSNLFIEQLNSFT